MTTRPCASATARTASQSGQLPTRFGTSTARVRGPTISSMRCRVDLERGRVDVDERRHESGLHDRRDVGAEGDRGRDDLVAGLEVEHLDRELDGGRARVDHDPVRLREQRRDRGLAGRDLRSEVEVRRAQDLDDGLDLAFVVHRTGIGQLPAPVDRSWPQSACPRRGAAGASHAAARSTWGGCGRCGSPNANTGTSCPTTAAGRTSSTGPATSSCARRRRTAPRGCRRSSPRCCSPTAHPARSCEIAPWIDARFEPIDEVILGRLEAQTFRRHIKTHTPAEGIPRLGRRVLHRRRTRRSRLVHVVPEPHARTCSRRCSASC